MKVDALSGSSVEFFSTDGFHSRVSPRSISFVEGDSTEPKRERGGESRFSFSASPKMSKLLETQVWHSDLKAELKPLAAVVADMGNDDGHGIYPSVAYLAWLLGRSERSVQSSLAALAKLGILKRITHKSGGRGNVPHYRLHANKLPKRLAWREAEKDEESAPFIEKGEKSGNKRVQDFPKRVQSTTQKGAEFSIKGAGFAPDPLVDPSVVEPLEDPSGDPPHSGEAFREALESFERERSAMRKPLTTNARRLLYKKLAGWPESVATQALEDSVINRWQGVFEPRSNGNGPRPPSGKAEASVEAGRAWVAEKEAEIARQRNGA